ncbi:MAG: AAA family ATPase [Euryhalocaulis sp.]|uniref:AAA family ATPase n=1 Tax=Euryhalocaulis sp. TaxID=2744307 RepID=UPI0017B400AA|nr:AAA family ATPase [Euryhalocaulis sp.]MBA4801172.1 AAA family ATPase [Euryhalocaulis sp.]
MSNFVVISGCSGGGKSSLTGALARKGYATVSEPGRRIVQQEMQKGGDALPWIDPEGFAERLVETSLADYKAAPRGTDWAFFDRGLVDAAAYRDSLKGGDVLTRFGQAHRYHRRVFLAPPWPELFASDAERRHGFEDAVEEYERLAVAYPRLGYEVVTLPRTSVAGRVDFVLRELASGAVA